MSKTTYQWIYAAGIALAGGLADVAAQLANGTMNASRSVIAGVALGVVARVLGAALAAIPKPGA